jgi:hypothetical protein
MTADQCKSRPRRRADLINLMIACLVQTIRGRNYRGKTQIPSSKLQTNFKSQISNSHFEFFLLSFVWSLELVI